MYLSDWTDPKDLPLACALHDVQPWTLPDGVSVQTGHTPVLLGSGWPGLIQAFPKAIALYAATILPHRQGGRVFRSYTLPPNRFEGEKPEEGRLALLTRPYALSPEIFEADPVARTRELIEGALDPIGRDLWLCAAGLVGLLPLPHDLHVRDAGLLSWTRPGRLGIQVRPQEDLLKTGPQYTWHLNIDWGAVHQARMRAAGAFVPDGSLNRLMTVEHLYVPITTCSQHERLRLLHHVGAQLRGWDIAVPEILWST